MRANYQCFIWKQSHVAKPELPLPVCCGWKLDDDEALVVQWIDGDIMPQKLVDVLATDVKAAT